MTTPNPPSGIHTNMGDRELSLEEPSQQASPWTTPSYQVTCRSQDTQQDL